MYLASGLGTLHRHADARWRQTPKSVQELAVLQSELLSQASTYVKPEVLLYMLPAHYIP
jgi:16S rRNA (cytosine967-C5)-methyltransferase